MSRQSTSHASDKLIPLPKIVVFENRVTIFKPKPCAATLYAHSARRAEHRRASRVGEIKEEIV